MGVNCGRNSIPYWVDAYFLPLSSGISACQFLFLESYKNIFHTSSQSVGFFDKFQFLVKFPRHKYSQFDIFDYNNRSQSGVYHQTIYLLPAGRNLILNFGSTINILILEYWSQNVRKKKIF